MSTHRVEAWLSLHVIRDATNNITGVKFYNAQSNRPTQAPANCVLIQLDLVIDEAVLKPPVAKAIVAAPTFTIEER